MSIYRKMMVSYCATFDKTIETIVTMFYHEDDHDDHGDDMNGYLFYPSTASSVMSSLSSQLFPEVVSFSSPTTAFS